MGERCKMPREDVAVVFGWSPERVEHLKRVANQIMMKVFLSAMEGDGSLKLSAVIKAIASFEDETLTVEERLFLLIKVRAHLDALVEVNGLIGKALDSMAKSGDPKAAELMGLKEAFSERRKKPEGEDDSTPSVGAPRYIQ